MKIYRIAGMIQVELILSRVVIFLCILMTAGYFVTPEKVWASPPSSGTGDEIPLYTYHTHPPFIIHNGEGLTYDLADYLTAKSNGRFQFSVMAMSRPRANKMLAESKTGIIPWVNPVWFNDKNEKKYMWSRGALMEDSNAIISHRDRKIVYDGPESLDGMIFGGLKSHVYVGVDDYIRKTGRLRRVDVENHISNFQKLLKKRIDVTITPHSGAEYLIKREGLQEQLYISPTPHSQYKRRVIIINNRVEVLTFINAVLEEMATDPQWLKIRNRYQ